MFVSFSDWCFVYVAACSRNFVLFGVFVAYGVDLRLEDFSWICRLIVSRLVPEGLALQLVVNRSPPITSGKLMVLQVGLRRVAELDQELNRNVYIYTYSLCLVNVCEP